jgi:hypothetical protein
MKDLVSEPLKRGSSDNYLEYLATTLGASKEEILEVAKRSGVSPRRIAEYLLKQSTASSQYSDDE